jgi:hypothetical protein
VPSFLPEPTIDTDSSNTMQAMTPQSPLIWALPFTTFALPGLAARTSDRLLARRARE